MRANENDQSGCVFFRDPLAANSIRSMAHRAVDVRTWNCHPGHVWLRPRSNLNIGREVCDEALAPNLLDVRSQA